MSPTATPWQAVTRVTLRHPAPLGQAPLPAGEYIYYALAALAKPACRVTRVTVVAGEGYLNLWICDRIEVKEEGNIAGILTSSEVIIKSKRRVQQHGEVFTPKEIVDTMVTLPGVEESILQITATVLEPAAGEGAFLTNILERRLSMIALQYPDDIVRFENYALLAISTLYGIELLKDNAKKCAINLYMTFDEFYKKVAQVHNTVPKRSVLESAKTIASINIVQGDFLKRTGPDGSPIVFSEWAPIKLTKRTKHIRVLRTEYTLDDIYEQAAREAGTVCTPGAINKQMSMFDDHLQTEDKPIVFKFVPAKITDVYKQEMEEVDP